MDCYQMEALRNVIEYVREAEQKHFEEATAEERRNHIYQDVLTLEAYLDGDPNEQGEPA